MLGKYDMNNIKVCNIQQVYLNGSKATTFHVYQLIDNSYVFCYSDVIDGWFKRPATILNKHIGFNHKV